jgi:hypothetical protein
MNQTHGLLRFFLGGAVAIGSVVLITLLRDWNVVTESSHGTLSTPAASQSIAVTSESFAALFQALPIDSSEQQDLLPRAHRLLADLRVAGTEAVAASPLASERIELRYSNVNQNNSIPESEARGQPVRFLFAQLRSETGPSDLVRQDIVLNGTKDLFEETLATLGAKIGRPPDHTKADPNGGQNFASWDAPSGWHLWAAWNPLEDNPANQGVRITIEENIHPQP